MVTICFDWTLVLTLVAELPLTADSWDFWLTKGSTWIFPFERTGTCGKQLDTSGTRVCGSDNSSLIQFFFFTTTGDNFSFESDRNQCKWEIRKGMPPATTESRASASTTGGQGTGNNLPWHLIPAFRPGETDTRNDWNSWPKYGHRINYNIWHPVLACCVKARPSKRSSAWVRRNSRWER